MPETSHEHDIHERPRVLVFFDYACPFCYLDWPRFRRLVREHDAEVILCPYELRPQQPQEGVTLDDVGGGHSPKVREHMERMAREGGICFEEQRHVPNSHRALALGELARDGGEERHFAVHEAIYRAYYCDGGDIGDPGVLLGVADSCGLDGNTARRAVEGDEYDERLHQFRHLAMRLGVQATPSALICNQLFIGSRPYQVLSDAIAACMHQPVSAGEIIAEGAGREDEGEPATIRGG